MDMEGATCKIYGKRFCSAQYDVFSFLHVCIQIYSRRHDGHCDVVRDAVTKPTPIANCMRHFLLDRMKARLPDGTPLVTVPSQHCCLRALKCARLSSIRRLI